MSLDRDAILGADDLEMVEVDVPEWGDTVWVRTLTGKAKDRFETVSLGEQAKGKKNGALNLETLRARVLVEACVSEKGERLFDVSDIEALGAKSGAALDRVFTVAQRLAGLSNEDVEELAKNSSSGAVGSSPSD